MLLGEVIETQHSVLSAARAPDMKLPIQQVAYRRPWHRVGVEGQLGHGSLAVPGGRAHDLQAQAAQFPYQVPRTHAAEEQVTRP